MLTTTKTTNLSGQSMIGDSVVAYMNATVQENGALNISKNVQDQDLFLKNIKEVKADMTAFEALAYTITEVGVPS